MDQLEATVEGTVYRNAENGYSVVTVKPEQKIGLRTVTVVGTLPMLSGGEMGIFSGEWMEHPQYGRQFKCQKVELQRPTTLQGILKYLSSGIIHGVGAKTARDIVNCFGEDTLKILDEHPERLQEVPNMGKKRWKQIIEDYQQQQSTRAAMVFFADVRRERVAGAENQQSVRGADSRRSSGRIRISCATILTAWASKRRTPSARHRHPPGQRRANQRRAQVRPARSGSEHGACLSADG